MKRNKNSVLRLSTSGSVDDGKSTLIGRILYDTNSLPQDKLAAIEKSSRQRGYDYLDFSFATDGLIAEREQGITIDVAHIYFSTPDRSYIIADTPGHIEYTRNMVTGTSTSQTAFILIDARNGVVEQTRRHFYINNLLRIDEVVVAINKMDLVDFSREVYTDIIDDFRALIEAGEYKNQRITFIPVSAKWGDNVVEKSERMPWYTGKSLLEYLESIDVEELASKGPARFQVQTVIRPRTEEYRDFRGYAGKLKGGDIAVGDEVTVLPSKTQSKIASVRFFDKEFESATAGSSITITLADDVNVSRGDMIVKTAEMPKESKLITADICWMDNQALMPGTVFKLQHGVNLLKAKIKSVQHKVDLENPGNLLPADQLNMNDLGRVEIQLAKPFYYDTYEENKENGAFILIDTKSNTTAGVGFLR